MRSLRPEPLSRLKSTPNSRANLRIEGLACARKNDFWLTNITIGGGRRAGSLETAPELIDSDFLEGTIFLFSGAVASEFSV